eukprot:7256028-Alexandrium_andersonii.AAC.1
MVSGCPAHLANAPARAPPSCRTAGCRRSGAHKHSRDHVMTRMISVMVQRPLQPQPYFIGLQQAIKAAESRQRTRNTAIAAGNDTRAEYVLNRAVAQVRLRRHSLDFCTEQIKYRCPAPPRSPSDHIMLYMLSVRVTGAASAYSVTYAKRSAEGKRTLAALIGGHKPNTHRTRSTRPARTQLPIYQQRGSDPSATHLPG